MKVPDSGHEERMLACGESWTLDGQAGMSKEGDSPDYEYWRRLREHEVRSNRLSWMVMSVSADMSVYYFIYFLLNIHKQKVIEFNFLESDHFSYQNTLSSIHFTHFHFFLFRHFVQST